GLVQERIRDAGVGSLESGIRKQDSGVRYWLAPHAITRDTPHPLIHPPVPQFPTPNPQLTMPPVLSLAPDLMIRSKIDVAARHYEVAVRHVASEAEFR